MNGLWVESRIFDDNLTYSQEDFLSFSQISQRLLIISFASGSFFSSSTKRDVLRIPPRVKTQMHVARVIIFAPSNRMASLVIQLFPLSAWKTRRKLVGVVSTSATFKFTFISRIFATLSQLDIVFWIEQLFREFPRTTATRGDVVWFWKTKDRSAKRRLFHLRFNDFCAGTKIQFFPFCFDDG